MARLTILQASQQGFGSTLTIHRHIKDGSLPIYEEGDVKLLEVDDLISLFGEPGLPVNDNQTGSEQPEIDIYEYNRMKSELDQKNKKNMWLAADLAEAVRDFKDKEASFHAERERLLKILEQAQALLLREAKRAGAGLKKKDVDALNTDSEEAAPDRVPRLRDQAPSPSEPDHPPPDIETAQPGADRFMQDAAADAMQPGQTMDDDDFSFPGDDPGPDADTLSEPSPDVLTQPGGDTPAIVLDEGEVRGRRRGNAANPLMPPLEAEEEKPAKSRLMGTFSWLMLFSVVGCGLVFLKFKPQIMTSIEEIMQVLGGA